MIESVHGIETYQNLASRKASGVLVNKPTAQRHMTRDTVDFHTVKDFELFCWLFSYTLKKSKIQLNKNLY